MASTIEHHGGHSRTSANQRWDQVPGSSPKCTIQLTLTQRTQCSVPSLYFRPFGIKVVYNTHSIPFGLLFISQYYYRTPLRIAFSFSSSSVPGITSNYISISQTHCNAVFTACELPPNQCQLTELLIQHVCFKYSSMPLLSLTKLSFYIYIYILSCWTCSWHFFFSWKT